MKKVRFEIDLSEWDLRVFDQLEKTIMEATEKTLKCAFEHKNTYIYFPVESSPGGDGIGGPPVDDPLTVYLRVALDSLKEPPTFEFNLRKCVKDAIRFCAEDDWGFSGLEKLMHALHALADEIEEALPKST